MEYLVKVDYGGTRKEEQFIIDCEEDKILKTISHKMGIPVHVHNEYLYSEGVEISVYELDEVFYENLTG